MSESLLIALAQLNPTVGDITGNCELIRAARAEAAEAGADLIVFSELFITGYPPEDLILKPSFQAAAEGGTKACRRDGGWRPSHIGRHAMARGRQTL